MESKLQSPVILVAEDNEINRLLLNAQLAPTGASVVEGKDGTEALALIRQMRFDLILMDLHMPGTDGPEIMRYIKATPTNINHHTPVIAITAYAPERQLASLADEGFAGYLIKPVLTDDLHAIVKRFCTAKKINR